MTTSNPTPARPSPASPSQHPTRLPGSVSSLHVQLSHSELARQHQRQEAPPSPLPSSYSFTTPQQRRTEQNAAHLVSSLNATVQPTDVQLLATSILGNQARQRQTLQWSERLINLSPSPSSSSTSTSAEKDGGGGQNRGVNRETLRRSLVFLSPSSWLAVLDERYLAGSCPYPTCHSPAPSPPRTRGEYRISLKSRTIHRNTGQDPGDRQTFCSTACFRRAEWVRTWILKDREESKLPRSPAAAAVAGAAAGEREGEERGAEGGRWERMMNDDAWQDIELLEDLEERGEVNRLLASGEGAKPPTATNEKKSKQPQPQPQSQPQSTPSTATAGKDKPSRKAAQDQVSELLDSLHIYERAPTAAGSSNSGGSGGSNSGSAILAPRPTATRTNRGGDYETDVPSYIGARFVAGAGATPSLIPSVGGRARAGTGKKRTTARSSTTSTTTAKNDEDDDRDDDEEDDDDEDTDLLLGLTSPSHHGDTRGSVHAILATSQRVGMVRGGDSIDNVEEEEEGEEEEPPLDPIVAAQREEVQRQLDEAIRVRDQQRELGLLD